MRAGRRVRVALASVGLGRVQRGFERWASDLANLFDGHPGVDLTTYGSSLTGLPGEAVARGLKPVTRLVRKLPLQLLAGTEEYKRDSIAFALCLLPDLRRTKYDVIHVVDPPLAVALGKLRRIVPFSGKLLFTDGSGIPLEYCPAADHLHHVGWKAHLEALNAGIDPAHLTFIPSGLDTAVFAHPRSREDLRRKYGISDSTFVVLMVSALKRDHKRVDHVIREVSRLPGDVLLWLDGNPEDPEIPILAEQLLGPRCRITHVPSEDVPDLYQTADVMVHAAVTEAFGLTIVEALCSGLTVLTHQDPHFEWLVQDPSCHLDMTAPGRLAARLAEMLPARDLLVQRAHAASQSVRERFDWRVLRGDYAEMYRKVAGARHGDDVVGVERPFLAPSRNRIAGIEKGAQ